jgi:phosphate transport system permease protein
VSIESINQPVPVSLADSTSQSRRVKNGVFLAALWFSVLVALLTLFTLVISTFVTGRDRLATDLVINMPSPFPDDAGVQAALFGSLWVTLTAGIVSLIQGVGTAIYLEEFVNQNSRIQRFITVNIQTLAGVPSIVFGILGLAFVVRGPLGWGFTVGSAAAVLTMLVLPLMIVSSREALRAVPPSLREGAYALGATRWQTVRKQVLPAAVPGIATGSILGVSRALGESAPLILLGALAYVSFNPTGYDDGYTVLPLLIFKWSSEVREEFRILSAASIIVLLALLLVLNSLAIFIRNRSMIKW